ncbi:ABC transporter permease [Azospirillum halopraeferens]|uniref:ABC transporter permease n=1 Tax=Azospirillum halopraeferens TaxID=34010 RepID=UPI0003FE1E69|nr:ABC transporter permease [Azospirillum halopraeferens]
MALPLAVDVAVTHLRGRKRQTLVSVLGVALGVGFFIAMTAMMQGFQGFFISTVVDVAPHITISDEFREPERQPAVTAFPDGAVRVEGVKPRDQVRGIKGGPGIVEAIRRLPGVEAAPSLSGQVFLRYGAAERNATLSGIEPSQELRITRLEKDMLAGSLRDLQTRPDGVVLGAGLAKRLGAGMSDRLTAISPAGVIRRVTVVGIYRTGVSSFDDGQAIMLLKEVQILQDRPNVINRIRIRMDDIDAAGDLAARLEARYAYKAESWQEANQGVFSVFRIQSAVMYSTVGAIMVVAAFGIFNIISTVVYEKSRDIAIMKSLGFAEGDIHRIFILEGLLVGVIGALLGWVIGYALVSLLGSLRFNFGGGTIQNDRFHLAYSFVHYAVGGAFSVTAATLAAYIPARRAARLNPVEIVRGAA